MSIYSISIGQSCYYRLFDGSGYNTAPYQNDLELAACRFIQSFPREYQDSIKVFDFGFYPLAEKQNGGTETSWQKAINQANQQSKYYVIFGKVSGEAGIYYRFLVDINLPIFGESVCQDKKPYFVTSILAVLNANTFADQYAYKEILALETLERLVTCEDCLNGKDDDGDGFVDCEDLDCYYTILSAGNVSFNTTGPSSVCPVLSSDQIACLSGHFNYLKEIRVNDIVTALEICEGIDEFTPSEAPIAEPVEINNGITICDAYVPVVNPQLDSLMGQTVYRHPWVHGFPPNDMDYDVGQHNTDKLSLLNRGLLNAPDSILFENFKNLLDYFSNTEYRSITDKYYQKFRNNEGGEYADVDISERILTEIETRNKFKLFAENFNDLISKTGGAPRFLNEELDPSLRFKYQKSQGYAHKGPTILINDTEQTSYYLQSYAINNSTKVWTAYFYVEVLDHFGLGLDDLLKFQDADYHLLGIGKGFASWWLLQHTRGYRPFRTKLRFIVCLSGKLKDVRAIEIE